MNAPTNNKSLIHFLFNQMEKLDKKEISVDESKAMANLAREVNNSMKYELQRAALLKDLEGSTVKLRNVEVTNPEA